MDQPIRILVVDEDPHSRQLLTAALAADGAQKVVAVSLPQQALAKLADEDFSLIICDLTMPEAAGLEFITSARAASGNKPILVFSAVQTDETVAKALELGADDYLQKPVDLRELRRSIAVLINRYYGRAAASDKRAASGGDAAVPPVPASYASVRSIAEGTYVELVATSDAVQAERFQRFAERLLAASLTEKERHNLHLALEEILHNALEWGNQLDHSKQLRLSYCILPDRITFRIEDEGEGFDPSQLKDPSINPQAHIQERRCSGKRMGGWGIFLTRKLMDRVTFNDKGNVVFLTKFLKNRTYKADTRELDEEEMDLLKDPQEAGEEQLPSPPEAPPPPFPQVETSDSPAKNRRGRSTRRVHKMDLGAAGLPPAT
jgi:DNA-binding response OmpR family regulator